MKGLVSFAKESLGVQLWPGQVEVLEGWAESGKRKAVLCLGRRSGKGVMAASAAIYNAVMPDYSALLRPGEARFIVVVATRQEQARESIRVIRELLEHAPDPALARLVDKSKSTTDEIVFRTDAVVRAMPCSSRSTRGLGISLLILDEAAHMSTADEGFAAGAGVYQALAPGTITFGAHGYIMLTSSPQGLDGIFATLFKQGETEAVPDIYAVRRPTWEMNPAATRASLASEFLADPDGSRVEYGAEFLSGSGAFLPPEAVALCIVRGRASLPVAEGVHYWAACDPAFSAGGDKFGFAIGHRIGHGEEAAYVLDRLTSWQGRKSPLNSDLVVDEITELLREYRITDLHSDQYSAVTLTDAFRRRGITMKAQALTNESKWTYFAGTKRLVNTGRVELLDIPALSEELCALEVTSSATGKPKVAAARGHHDDLSMAVATVLHAMRERSGSVLDAGAFAANAGLAGGGASKWSLGGGGGSAEYLAWKRREEGR